MLPVRDGSGIPVRRDSRFHALIAANLPVASGFHTREIKGEHTDGNNVFCKSASSHTGPCPTRGSRDGNRRSTRWSDRSISVAVVLPIG